MAPLVVGAFFFGILFYVIVVELGNIIALKTEPNPQFVGQMSALTNIAMICGTLLFGFLKSRLSGSALLTLERVHHCSGLPGNGYSAFNSDPRFWLRHGHVRFRIHYAHFPDMAYGYA